MTDEREELRAQLNAALSAVGVMREACAALCDAARESYQRDADKAISPEWRNACKLVVAVAANLAKQTRALATPPPSLIAEREGWREAVQKLVDEVGADHRPGHPFGCAICRELENVENLLATPLPAREPDKDRIAAMEKVERSLRDLVFALQRLMAEDAMTPLPMRMFNLKGVLKEAEAVLDALSNPNAEKAE